jgi:hypothetical protein
MAGDSRRVPNTADAARIVANACVTPCASSSFPARHNSCGSTGRTETSVSDTPSQYHHCVERVFVIFCDNEVVLITLKSDSVMPPRPLRENGGRHGSATCHHLAIVTSRRKAARRGSESWPDGLFDHQATP